MSKSKLASTERLSGDLTLQINRTDDRNLRQQGYSEGIHIDNNVEDPRRNSHQFNPKNSLLLSSEKKEKEIGTSKSSRKFAMSTSDISTESNKHNNNDVPEGRMRLFISLLGLTIAVVNCYSQAAFCMAIVEMVIPSDYNTIPSNATISDTNNNIDENNRSSIENPHNQQAPNDESCPILPDYSYFYDDWRFPLELPSELSASSHTQNHTHAISLNEQHKSQTDNNFTSIDHNNNNHSTNENNLTTQDNRYQQQQQQPILNLDNRFIWDASQQGFLLAAAAVGMAPLQIIGGRLAEVYGPKWVLLVSCAGTAITNLTIPIMAHGGFMLLLLNRFLMGMSQGGMEPGVMCLLANWLPPSEVGFYISMLLFAMCIGGFLGSLLSSLLLTTSYGWPMTHYASGVLNLIAAIIWYQFASNKPRESAYITEEELDYIERMQTRPNNSEPIRNDHGHDHAKTSINQTAKQSNSEENICNPSKITLDLNSNIVNEENDTNNNAKTRSAHLIDCIKTNQPVIPTPSLSKRSSSTSPTIAALTTPNNVIKITTSYNDKKNKIDHLASDDNHEQSNTNATPWKAILKTPAVWAFIICKVSVRWTADTLALMLPTYLANVLHLSIKLNGYINGLSTALFALFSFLAAYAFSELSKMNYDDEDNNNEPKQKRAKRGLSKTNLRKIAQSIASFGSAIAIFLMSKYACNLSFSMSMLLVVSFCLVMGTGGELQIPYDMTAIYPGTLHGMACTLSVSGWLAPSLIGLILGDHPNSKLRWSLVWYMTATINFIGGLVFVLFADASPRNFHKAKDDASNNPTQMNFRARCDETTSSHQNDDSNDNLSDENDDENFHKPFRETKFSDKKSLKRDKTEPHHLMIGQYFDNERKVKIRQPDNCFIQSASYLSGLDSLPVTLVPMFPYKTSMTTTTTTPKSKTKTKTKTRGHDADA